MEKFDWMKTRVADDDEDGDEDDDEDGDEDESCWG